MPARRPNPPSPIPSKGAMRPWCGSAWAAAGTGHRCTTDHDRGESTGLAWSPRLCCLRAEPGRRSALLQSVADPMLNIPTARTATARMSGISAGHMTTAGLTRRLIDERYCEGTISPYCSPTMAEDSVQPTTEPISTSAPMICSRRSRGDRRRRIERRDGLIWSSMGGQGA